MKNFLLFSLIYFNILFLKGFKRGHTFCTISGLVPKIYFLELYYIFLTRYKSVSAIQTHDLIVFRGASSSGCDGRVSVRAGARRGAGGVRFLRHAAVRATGWRAQSADLPVRQRRPQGQAPRHRAADQVRRVRNAPGKGEKYPKFRFYANYKKMNWKSWRNPSGSQTTDRASLWPNGAPAWWACALSCWPTTSTFWAPKSRLTGN